MSPSFRFAIGFATLLLLVVLPLGIFIRRSGTRVNAGLYWVVLYPLWYLTNSVFHEGAHYLVNLATGVQVTRVRLIPRFWAGDFADAFVDTGPWNHLQAVLGSMAPYVTGLLWMGAGLLILPRMDPRRMLPSCLVLTVFILRPLADLVNNVLGWVVFRFGDFEMAARAMGRGPTGALALVLVVAAFVGTLNSILASSKKIGRNKAYEQLDFEPSPDRIKY